MAEHRAQPSDFIARGGFSIGASRDRTGDLLLAKDGRGSAERQRWSVGPDRAGRGSAVARRCERDVTSGTFLAGSSLETAAAPAPRAGASALLVSALPSHFASTPEVVDNPGDDDEEEDERDEAVSSVTGRGGQRDSGHGYGCVSHLSSLLMRCPSGSRSAPLPPRQDGLRPAPGGGEG